MTTFFQKNTAARVGFLSIDDIEHEPHFPEAMKEIHWATANGSREEKLLWVGAESARYGMLLDRVWNEQTVDDNAERVRRYFVYLLAIRQTLLDTSSAKWATTAAEWVERVIIENSGWEF